MRCASLVTLWKPTTAAAPLRVCALRRMSLKRGRLPGVRSSTTREALTVRRCSSASSRKISSISGSMSSPAGAPSRPSLPKLRGSGPRSSGEPSNTNASPNEATRGLAALGRCVRVRRHVGDDGEPLFDLVELTQHLGAAVGRQRAADERELLEDVLGAPRERAELVEADHRRRTRDGVGQPVGGLDLGLPGSRRRAGEHRPGCRAGSCGPRPRTPAESPGRAVHSSRGSVLGGPPAAIAALRSPPVPGIPVDC